MGFSEQIGKFVLKTNEAHGKIVRTATLELFSGVIKSTPVDTGRARGNWMTSVNAPKDGTTERLDQSGAQAVAEVSANTPPGAGQVTYLANSLPYIERLEMGSSKQAPAGMIRINMDRVSKMVEKAVAKHKV
jgi:hypothetical protein